MRLTESSNKIAPEKPDDSPVDEPQLLSGMKSNVSRDRVHTVLAALLIAYGASMFFGTHIPTVPSGLAAVGDKSLHFFGYAGLAALLMCWRATNGRWDWKTLCFFWLILAAYAAFDEVTQIPVGRHADIADWIADLAGSACGLAIGAGAARWISSDPKAEQPTPAD